MRKLCRLIGFTLTVILSKITFADMNTVSALTWWGYLDMPWVSKLVQEKCGVNLAIQDYKDNTDFDYLLSQNKYDIAIYEDTDLSRLHNKFDKINSKLWIQVHNYSKFAKEQYEKHVGLENSLIFLMSTTNFLYNPKLISINSKDTIQTIIQKLNKNKKKPYFVVLDDPNMLTYVMHTDHNLPLSIKTFEKEFGNYHKMIFSNDYNDYHNLGVIMTWSGQAYEQLEAARKQGVNLKIISIPRYSYASYDVLSQLNTNKSTSCVANLLGSRSFLNKLQNEVYYFSPYGDYENSHSVNFKEQYKSFVELGNKDQLIWQHPSEKEVEEAQKAWEKISIKYGF